MKIGSISVETSIETIWYGIVKDRSSEMELEKSWCIDSSRLELGSIWSTNSHSFRSSN